MVDNCVPLARRLASAGLARVGDVGRSSRTFAEADVAAFAALTHDDNPLHADAAFSANALFGKPVVHGMLYASMFGAIVGRRFPGAVYLSQSLRFRAPVHLGDTLIAEIEVSRVAAGGRMLDFATQCTNQHSRLVLQGEARVLMPRQYQRAPREETG